MPKVLIIQPFHEQGMKLFEARPDVACEVVDGALEELAEQIVDADGVTIRTMAISTARNMLAGIDGKLDPSMVVTREVL